MAQRTVAVNVVANTAAYVAGMSRAGAATGAFGGLVKSAIGRLLGPAALVGALQKSAQASLKFNDEMVKLQTQIGLSSVEVDKLRQSALSLGGATTKGPQELAEAAFFIASAGLRGAAATDVLRKSAQLSAIGMGSTATIADTLTSAVNAYGVESLNAAQASDVLVSAVRLGKASADELAGSMGKVLPIASAMGVSFDEVGGIIAAMTRTGTDAATASTQLRAIMVSLLKPTEQAAEVMLELGLSSSGLRNTIQEDGLFKALTDIQTATGGSTEKMAELFPNVRALAGAMDLLGPQLEENAALMAEIADSAGVAEDAYSTFSLTTRAEMDRLSASVSRAMISVGDSTTGPIAVSVRILSSAFGTLGDAVEMVNDKAMFHERALTDAAGAMGVLNSITAGLTGTQLEAALQSDAYSAALRQVDDTAKTLRSVEHDLGMVTERRGFLTRDANEFDEEKLRLHELNLRATLANLDPMRAQNATIERFNRLATKYSEAAGDAADATDDFTDSLGFSNEELDDMISNIDRARDAKRRLVDPVFDLMRAEDDLAEAQADLNELMQDAETDSSVLAGALVDLQLKHGAYDHALETSGVFIDGYIGELNEMIEAGRFSEEQVQLIIDRLEAQGLAMELIDGKVVRTTHVHEVITVHTSGPELIPGTFQPRRSATPTAPRQRSVIEIDTGDGGRPVPRRLGGAIQPNRMFLVGEAGPELIVPSMAGSVIPAHLTRAMMEGNSGAGIVIQEYHTHQHVDDQALVAMLEMRQEAGRL